MRKRCKRKIWALVNPITHAIAGAALTSESDLDKLRLTELSAIEAFRMGHAQKADWMALADMCNVLESMCHMKIGPEAMEPGRHAQEALGEIHARYKRTGRFGVAGVELEALREAFRWHDAQRSQISRSQYEAAIKRTVNRIKSAHPSVKVYA